MSEPDVTEILRRASSGDGRAAADLLPLVYEQLRRAAQNAMRAERADHTLQATALVHEAYARVVGAASPGFEGRAHFYFAASRAMQQLLVEHARSRGRLKRGGTAQGAAEGTRARLTMLDIADLACEADESEILALDEAVRRLEEQDPEAVAVVRLRFYAGLTGEQTAEALGISPRQVDRIWSFARAFLFRHVEQSGKVGGGDGEQS